MRVAGVVLVVLLACTVVAQEHQHGTAADEKLGTTHFATSCTRAVQPAFDRGIALLHSFDFPRAVAAFESVASADPACGMAYWGLALTRWGNPFLAGARPVAQLRQGGEAIARAQAAGTTTARERAYIDAAAHLYSSYETIPQPARLRAYRDAMREVSARHPDDTEAAIFYALALAFSADPADKTYASQLKAGAILEGLFAQQPNHPGLAHYIIHGYDVPVLAARAVAAARRYATIAPSAPHALHMPSHTFTRVGSWQESIDANIAAAVAAKREGATAEELHASDYQMYAYLQTGQDRAVERLLEGAAGDREPVRPGGRHRRGATGGGILCAGRHPRPLCARAAGLGRGGGTRTGVHTGSLCRRHVVLRAGAGRRASSRHREGAYRHRCARRRFAIAWRRQARSIGPSRWRFSGSAPRPGWRLPRAAATRRSPGCARRPIARMPRRKAS